ncbi:MAG TPA: anti-sigma factor, partial [Burkholderiales bacterium]
MTQPPITDAQLQAWIDGQLDADATRALEAWLADRPEEAARGAALRAQRDALRAHFLPVLDESIPETMLRATGHPQRRW